MQAGPKAICLQVVDNNGHIKIRGRINHLKDLSLQVKYLTIRSRLIFTFGFFFPILWYALTLENTS